MNRRWQFLIYGIIVIVALIIGFRRVDKSTSPSSTPQVVHWKTKDPLLNPTNHPLVLGKSFSAHTQNLTLPKGQLSAAEWYLPITKTSAVSFILHDSQARWVDGTATYTLTDVPTDPVDELSYSANGQYIGWVTGQGAVKVLNGLSHHLASYSHSSAIAFTSQNIALTWNSMTHHIEENGHPLSLSIAGVPAQAHPLLQHGSLIATDQDGSLLSVAVPSGQTRLVATVNPQRWPLLLTARTLGSGIVLLLERTGPIPKYLLVIHQAHYTGWYRFVAYNPPELGVFQHHLVIENLLPNGAMAIIMQHTIHPLNVSAGIFSAGPFGIIWQGNSGFVKLTGVTP